jgi:integration host factor subunit beta
MTKSELIAAIAAKQPHQYPNDIELAVNNLLEMMARTLANGLRIELRGFGSFSVLHRKARMGRNPKTGETVSVPQSHALHFKAGLELREKVDAARERYPVIKD